MAWAALPIAGVLLLAGCGDDDDGDEAKTTPSASAPASAPESAPAGGGAVDTATFSADQKAAAEAYQKVFDPSASAADRKQYIQDSDKLSGMLDAMLGSPLVGSITAKTGDVKVSGDTGTVNFEIVNTTGGSVGMPATDGPVVKVDGQWKVGAKTVCTLAGYVNAPTPPDCANY
ncbi:hypothetical protein LO772_25450 [Yinghuangia sp. ASG 101]|uniref:hypothetical protein n=1 Tax=Yinghuangia sp. ASG 101 TaxID=2896848 RepID=UPI001E2EF06B|nr:hypothetical protein [Yinghuangia sp. ASG 101]UGQ10202.1 hypothetical protein LO772_25450 [Yinghuangia sp. ASG 101]